MVCATAMIGARMNENSSSTRLEATHRAAAAIGAPQSRREQHLGDARELGREHQRHGGGQQRPRLPRRRRADRATADGLHAERRGSADAIARPKPTSENRIQAGPDTYIRMASQSCSRPIAVQAGQPTRDGDTANCPGTSAGRA